MDTSSPNRRWSFRSLATSVGPGITTSILAALLIGAARLDGGQVMVADQAGMAMAMMLGALTVLVVVAVQAEQDGLETSGQRQRRERDALSTVSRVYPRRTMAPIDGAPAGLGNRRSFRTEHEVNAVLTGFRPEEHGTLPTIVESWKREQDHS